MTRARGQKLKPVAVSDIAAAELAFLVFKSNRHQIVILTITMHKIQMWGVAKQTVLGNSEPEELEMKRMRSRVVFLGCVIDMLI